MLDTERNGSLAASIELSLESPAFRGLGPNAREVLEVIAFFPQGVNEDNLDWLFPTLSNRSSILNDLCVLSLTYRRDGYVTMLAPLRDYFRPRDTSCSPLPHVIQHRLSGDFNRNESGPEEEQWIALGEGERLRACECYCILGNTCNSRREKKKAIKHFETALRIASSFNWRTQLFWIHHRLAKLFLDEDEFYDAYHHFERAKSYAIDDPYLLGHVMWLRACFWSGEDRFEEARSEARRAIDAFERLGAVEDVSYHRFKLKYNIEVRRRTPGDCAASYA